MEHSMIVIMYKRGKNQDTQILNYLSKTWENLRGKTENNIWNLLIQIIDKLNATFSWY